MNQLEFNHPDGRVFYVNHKEVTLKYGGIVQLYYLSLDPRPETAISELPEGREIVITKRGMPMVKNMLKPKKTKKTK